MNTDRPSTPSPLRSFDQNDSPSQHPASTQASSRFPTSQHPQIGQNVSESTHQPRSNRPIVTWVIIALNILVWLAMTLLGGSRNPYVLLRFGAKVNSRIVQGQIWRLVTPIFLHIGIVHLAFNTYAVYVFGSQIERVFGAVRFLSIYLLSGISGVLFSFVLNPHPAAGASGAIFGLIGTEAAFFYRYRNAFGRRGLQRFYNVLIVIGYNLAFTLTASNIDVWGHLGGLLAGVALGWGMMPHYAVTMTELGPRLIDRNRPRQWAMVMLGAVAFLVVSAWMAIAAKAAFWSP